MSASVVDVDALRARIGDRTIIASVSGGKDSAAARLYLREIGIPDSQVRNVAMDTGWEWSGWREYVFGPLAEVIGPIEIIGDPRGFAVIAEHKGMFPSRLRRWCTDLLKMVPFAAFIRMLQDDGLDPLVVVVIRAAESAARAKFPEWEEQEAYDAECWRPILSWSERDVIDIHARHGLKPNPLYLLGARRVGCWPCIYAGKEEIRLVAEVDPRRIDEIRDLEVRVTAKAQTIVAKRGEELKQPRSFFAGHSREGGMDIDRMVAWSRTAHGGVQMAVFQDAPDRGCMRWGLCETATDDAAPPDGARGSE